MSSARLHFTYCVPIGPILEFFKAGRRRAEEVTVSIHDFVVSIHSDDIAAIFDSLLFKFLEEVEDFDFLTAAVEDVADLDESGGAAGPASVASMRPAIRRACLDLWRSPWRSPMAIRRSGGRMEKPLMDGLKFI
ncbi:hypothetical protein L1987_37649 [Smallanthus sonchifolius]|uniref:Uncharacterized protein n=1 Tax=Smallanthus sonchifolius TaxID=185202 RepID=A0ACB9HHN3_9ASTR|nr:hypothetical protein L1987_37649 [Smallanthus sonchifolius]